MILAAMSEGNQVIFCHERVRDSYYTVSKITYRIAFGQTFASWGAPEDERKPISGVPSAIDLAARELTNSDIASLQLALPDSGFDNSFGNKLALAVSSRCIRAGLRLYAPASARLMNPPRIQRTISSMTGTVCTNATVLSDDVLINFGGSTEGDDRAKSTRFRRLFMFVFKRKRSQSMFQEM
jgi:hypothetical protein